MRTIDAFINGLAALPTDERTFNPYSEGEGAALRRENLQRYLTSMQQRTPRRLMLFEAPGYRGCAYSGLPITSERIMLAGVEKFALFGEGYHPTSDNPIGMAEASATILWNALVDHLEAPPLLWNTMPLHPHKPGEQHSNRTPTRSEQRLGHPFITALMALFPTVEQVLAVGRIAQRNLTEMGIEHTALRHPSQGGKNDFIAGLREATGT